MEKEIEKEINRLINIASKSYSKDSIDATWNEIKRKYGKKFRPEVEAIAFMGLGISWILAKIVKLSSKIIEKDVDELKKYFTVDDLAFLYTVLKDRKDIVMYIGRIASIYIRLVRMTKQD